MRARVGQVDNVADRSRRHRCRRAVLATALALSCFGASRNARAQHSGHPQSPLMPAPFPADQSVEERMPPERPGHSFVAPPPLPDAPSIAWRIAPEATTSAGHYSLDELLAVAAERNPTLMQSRLQIRGELGKAIQAGLYPNPVVMYHAEQIGVRADGGGGRTPGEWQGGVVQQRFVTGGKLELSRQKYLQRAKVAEYLAAAQQFRVCNDVRIHFYRTLAACQRVELRRELLKKSEDHSLTVREQYNLGQANAADVHRSNALLQKHRLAVLMAENEARQHTVEVLALAGIPSAQVSFTGSLESTRELLDYDAVLHNLLACSPELQAAHAKLREDGITLEREHVEWIPDLVVHGGAGYNYERGQTTGVAGLAVEVPLFDRNQGTIQQAEADLSRQRFEIQRIQLSLVQRLGEEYNRYLTALQHVTNYESVIVPEKKAAYRLTLESYKDDRIDWMEVLDAHEQYVDARLALVDHQRDRRVSETLLDGFLLHDGLQAAPGTTPPGHIDSRPKPR